MIKFIAGVRFEWLLVCVLMVTSCGGNDSTGQAGGAGGSSTSDGPTAPAIDAPIVASIQANPWYQAGEARVRNSVAYTAERGQARNVILFIGDGMGLSTVTAARILEGQNAGQSGEENSLAFERMPFSGLSKTYTVDAQTADSAGTMVAIMTGVKTDTGVTGVDEDVEYGDCSSVVGNELVTALELAEIAGLSTGFVTTARVTHATPAAIYARSPDRNWEDDSSMPPEALAAGCTDMARQLINFEAGLEARYPGHAVDGLEVIMGGGRRHFLPADPAANSSDAVSPVEGDRADGRHLVNEWIALYPDGRYAFDQASFDNVDPDGTEHLFGLFNEGHMQYAANRANDQAGEPGLAEMLDKALAILDNNPAGFFLVIEAGRIDHGHHAGNAYTALTDTIALSDAVERALALTDEQDTLVMVTADHGHVFTMAGDSQRGNPILGKVTGIGQPAPTLALDGRPYTTLGYINGRGFQNRGDRATDADMTYSLPINAGRVDLSGIDTTEPGFNYEALIGLEVETHGGEDVPVYARGPGASLITGTHEQNLLFHVMEFAADLTGRADAALAARD